MSTVQRTAFSQYSVLSLIVILTSLSIWAFWDTYLFREGRIYLPLEHIHGATMLAWLLLVGVQATLIGKGHTSLHRKLGISSVLLFMAAMISAIMLSWQIKTIHGLTPDEVYILADRAFLLSTFSAFYILALVLRKNRVAHPRWIICSTIVLLDPILNRITDNYIGSSYTTGIHQMISYAAMDCALLGLLALDWRRSRVFLFALSIMVPLQLMVLLGWESAIWARAVDWFCDLPLGGLVGV